MAGYIMIGVAVAVPLIVAWAFSTLRRRGMPIRLNSREPNSQAMRQVLEPNDDGELQVTNLIRPMTALLGLVLATSACAIASEETSDPNAGIPQVAGVCAPAVPDCEDTIVVDQGDPSDDDLFTDDEPRDGDTPPGVSGVLVGGGLTVPEALATDATGVIAVQGFYFDDGSGPRLCEALAESFPPQCGGASLALGDLSDIDLGLLQNNQGITWSDDSIVILGELAGGVLAPTPTSI